MASLLNFINTIWLDVLTIIISVFVCYIIFKIFEIYFKAFNLPPGPLPFPILGNILLFRSNAHWTDSIKKCSEKYGPVFTFWMGDKPYIFITDAEIGAHFFKMSESTGRERGYMASYFSNKKNAGIIFSDGRQWEVLRQIMHSTIQKYSKKEKLKYIVSDCVMQTLEEMKITEGFNKEFCAEEYIYMLFLRIMATVSFGPKFSSSNPGFKKVKSVIKDFTEEIGSRLALWEFSPLIRLLDWKLVKKHKKGILDYIDTIKAQFDDHLIDFDETTERDICDALIIAKINANKNGKVSKSILNDENFSVCMAELFLAGIETSAVTFNWALLYLTYYPKIKENLLNEIEREIGERIPSQEDMSQCHYTMAFLTEVLRIRNVAPVSFPHRIIKKTKIGDHDIPEDIGVFLFHQMILLDEKNWPNANEFIPERFLNHGNFMLTRNKANIPFGVGRRICLGEKLAMADLFLVLVRFLQLTVDFDLVIGTNRGLEINPRIAEFVVPYEYKIRLQPK